MHIPCRKGDSFSLNKRYSPHPSKASFHSLLPPVSPAGSVRFGSGSPPETHSLPNRRLRRPLGGKALARSRKEAYKERRYGALAPRAFPFFFLNEETAAEKRFEGSRETERDQREEIAREFFPLQMRYGRNAHKITITCT